MKVLCIVAHPDDEVLGAGATLAKHALDGDEVHILILTDGESSRGALRERSDRSEMARQAAKALGVRPPIFLNLYDQRLDQLGLLYIVQEIEKVFAKIKPDTVYTHFIGDLNLDHSICARAVLTACRPLPNFCVRRIYAMEVPSSTEWAPQQFFVPNRFVEAFDSALNRKDKALDHYGSEIPKQKHARSRRAIDSLQRLRGESVGVFYAEAFITVREII